MHNYYIPTYLEEAGGETCSEMLKIPENELSTKYSFVALKIN